MMRDMSSVLLNVDNGIATITLNRPSSLNAINENMAHQWAHLTTQAIEDPTVQAILITGTGTAFCAGGDVKSMLEMDDRQSGITALAQQINQGIMALVNSSKPVIAAAHGTTAGGGLGLLLATDYAIIGQSSRVGSLYAGVGLTPDLSVSALLAHSIGLRRALQLTLTNTLLDADQALEWGLVAEVVADDHVLTRAEEIAHEWVKAPFAFGQAKRLIRTGVNQDMAAHLEDEAHTIGQAATTAEAQQRMKAFVNR